MTENLPRVLDVLVDLAHQASGNPKSYLYLMYEGIAKKQGTKDGKGLYRRLPAEEEARMRESFQKAAPYFIAEAEKWAKTLPVSERFNMQSSVASHELVERVKSEPRGPRLPTKAFLRNAGDYWWPRIFGQGNDIRTIEGARETLRCLVESAETEEKRLLLFTLDGQEIIFGASLWAHHAYPVVQLKTHKYAAALMATGVPRDMDIRTPWGSFLIDLPTNLLHTTTPESNEFEWLTSILVTKLCDRWSFTAFGEEGTNLHRWGRSLEQMIGEVLDADEDAFPNALHFELEGQDNRTLVLLTRLVLNVCITMSDPSEVRPIGHHPRGWVEGPGTRRKGTDPIYRNFRVGKSIDLDVRPALRDYVEGIRKTSPTVQFLVRGHWRNQACGPKLGERRMKWIEPYWKGPEDAVINVRPHILGGY